MFKWVIKEVSERKRSFYLPYCADKSSCKFRSRNGFSSIFNLDFWFKSIFIKISFSKAIVLASKMINK